MINADTWKAYMYMKVTLENIHSGKFPNGVKFKQKDYEDAKEQVELCTQVLIDHNVDLPIYEAPVIEPVVGSQLDLFMV